MADFEREAILVFPVNGTGNIPPTRWIRGPDTGLVGPAGFVKIGESLVCAQDAGSTVTTSALEADEDEPATSTLAGSATFLHIPLGIVAY